MVSAMKKKIRIMCFMIIILSVIGCEGLKNKVSEKYVIPEKEFINITSVEIEKNKEKTVIVKSGCDWVFNGKENSENEKNKAKYLIYSLKKLEIKAQYNCDKNERKKYGIEYSKIKIKIFVDKKMYIEFKLGKIERQNMKSYIMTGNNIYAVDRLLYNIFNIKY